MGKYNSRQTEAVTVLETYPDGSQLVSQWNYQRNPEGWVKETWLEPAPRKEKQ
jgi:hypothetical protein